MEKLKIQLTDSVSVGYHSPTALNVLIGANTSEQYENEIAKISTLDRSKYPITLLTDLSLLKVDAGNELWRHVVRDSRFLSGTVPVYQTIGADGKIDAGALLELIHEQAEFGVKLITIHPTATVELMQMSKNRRCPITSRGGAAVCADMIRSKRTENVYMGVLDEIIKLARKCNVVISIGSTFRSANLHDAMDTTYQEELRLQIDIANYCKQRSVDVILETPGHAAPQHIFEICEMLKEASPFPIMPLGPMPTDCAFEQDDFAAAVGAILMGTHGYADILSVVTREEHMGGIPAIESLFDALEKYSVAKHIIDIYKIGDVAADDTVSKRRSFISSCIYSNDQNCSRCGAICPLKTIF